MTIDIIISDRKWKSIDIQAIRFLDFGISFLHGPLWSASIVDLSSIQHSNNYRSHQELPTPAQYNHDKNRFVCWSFISL